MKRLFPITAFGLLAAITVMTGSLLAILYTLKAEQDVLRHEFRQSALWFTTQAEREFRIFLDDANAFHHGSVGVKATDVVTGFDVAWSRIDGFGFGAIGRQFDKIDKDDQTIRGINRDIAALDEIVTGNTRPNPALNTKIQTLGKRLLQSLHSLSLQTNHYIQQATLERRERFSDLYLRTILLIVGLMGGGGLLVAFSIFNLRTSRSARLEAEKSERIKTEFLANMSHELRTPLNAVIGFTDILRMETFGPLKPKQKEYVTDIGNSGQHLLSLINDILDFSKTEAESYRIDIREFRLQDQIDMVFRQTSPAVRVKKLNLKIDLHDSDERILIDRRAFHQVLLNIASNAVKYTPEAGSILVRTSREHNQVVITVSDTGVGIPPFAMDTIFTPFARVEGAHNRSHEGTGLGLAICKALVAAQNGSIEISSRLDEGTEVTLKFPVSLAGG